MKLGILSSNFLSNDIDELKLSKLASNRMRLNVAKNAALRLGIEVEKLDFYNNSKTVDFLLIGKYVHMSGANIFIDDDGTRIDKWMGCIEKNKNNKSKIILDYTDHLLIANDCRSEFYRKIIPYIDIAIVPSIIMKKNLKKSFNGEIRVIEEPLEENVIGVANSSFDKIRALWFGHSTNLIYLFEYLKKDVNINELVIVTSLMTEDEKNKIKKINNKITFEFYKWEEKFYSKNNLKCNICLIPSNVGDERKNGASNNRLITAFALGLIPVATKIGSYLEYSDYFIDINIFDKTDKKNLVEISNKLKQNQEEIVNKYKYDEIVEKWMNLFV